MKKSKISFLCITILLITASMLITNLTSNAEVAASKPSGTASANPVIGIGRGTDFAKVTKDAISNAGGLKSIIKKGDTVIIKPNLINAARYSKGVCTDYRVIQKIADEVKACGAAKIIVAEASPAGNIFKNVKYNDIKGVQLLDMNTCGKSDCYRIKPKNSLTGHTFYIPKVYMDAKVVISAAKLKTHSDAAASLSLKNSFGIPPTSFYKGGTWWKQDLHNLGVDDSIVDLNKIRKPDFSVIDGIVGLEGDGPVNGKPVKSNIVFAGKDPVAIDTVALNFMGFKADEVPHVPLAAKEGLGVSDLSKIKIVGAELNKIKMDFERAR